VLPDAALAVADPRANQIFRIEPGPSFAVSVLAGDGHPSQSTLYDGVPGLRARFFGPSGIAADGAGNLYVADTHNHCIRRIANDAVHTVTTFAGALGTQGYADGTGASARFSRPMGIAWDGPRNRLVVADSANHRVRAIDVATAAVTTLAGSDTGTGDGPGASARCSFPTAVAIAEDGRVFVLSSGDSLLKVVGTDPLRTMTSLVVGGAGYADGPGTTAKIAAQGGLAWAAGSLYMSDPGNSRIRLVRPGVDAAGTTVSSWAGTGLADGPTALGLPLGLALGTGVLYVVDAHTGSARSIPR
jgi:DNA-binding beta-propeller fold protein YncE